MSIERTRLGAEAAGLVVMLDVAGVLVATLEDRVATLEEALDAERAERAAAEELLARLRAYDDTAHVTPPRPPSGDDEEHEHAAR